MTRMSSLPLAQFCPVAAKLSNEVGSGRAAAISSAFHALMAGEIKASGMIARLTNPEKEELMRMNRPADFPAGVNATLSYADAHKEIPCGLTEQGGYCEKDDPKAIAAGTCDMAWEPVRWADMAVLYVGDIKRSEWTASPDSLQLAGYALALAAKWDATHICTGIWDATGGQWSWSAITDLAAPEGAALWEKVKASAMNIEGGPATGAHCNDCYGRMRCPAWVLPPEHAETTLAPFVGADIALDNEKALALLLACDRAEDLIERIKGKDGLLRPFAAKNGIVDAKSGMRWMPVEVAGRESLDKKAIEAKHPGLLDEFTKVGKPSQQFRWLKLPVIKGWLKLPVGKGEA
jgi:hypothetical protein